MMKDERGHWNASTDDNVDPPASAKAEVDEEVNNSPRQSSTRTGKKKTLEALCSIRCHYNSMAHLKSVEEFYSPRKADALDSADKVLQITFSTCTPGLLVRPPLHLQPQEHSPTSDGDKYITLANSENMSDMTNMELIDMESSSETGWSVRNNPIASRSSCKPDADSDEEDFVRKISKHETTVNVNDDQSSATSSVEHILNLDSEAEAYDHYGRERVLDLTLGSDMSSPSKKLFLSEERVIKPYESQDAEPTKRTRKLLSRSSSYNPLLGPSRSSIVEDNCSCSEVRGDLPKGGHEVEVLSSTPHLLSVQVSGRIVDVISNSWRGVLSYSDLFLGGSLLIALALPFAIMVSKLVVSSSPEQFRYVPT